MKKILAIMLSIVALTAQAQSTTDHWYGYPHDRQVSAITGGITGAFFYSVARANMQNEPKWKSMLVSTGATLLTSAIITAMPQTHTERRQNFTTCMASGISITLVFSLGI